MVNKEREMRTLWAKRLPVSVPRWYNVRMGQLPDVDMAAAYKVIQGYADLVYVSDGFVHIVEFKIRGYREAVGQLLSYRQEFPKTPEFAPYAAMSIKLILVADKFDAVTNSLCGAYGILFEPFELV